MTLIYERKLADNVPHRVMGYHSYDSITDMSHYIVRTDEDAEDAPTFGLEIECTKYDGYIEDDELEELFGMFPFFQLESDSSIPGSGSMELITQPMTLKALKEAGFEALMNALQDHGFKAYSVTNRDNGSGCGGHIHINKGDNWKRVVALMAMFIDQNKEIMQIICKRPFTDYACNNLRNLGNSTKRYSLDYVEKYMQNNSGIHSNVINLQHSATIEFRLPVGTLDYETKMAHIELLNNMYQCCDDVITGKARVDRLTINKVCQSGEFLPKLMSELCISCSKKLVILDKQIKARVDAFNVNKCKVVKALSDLQLALAIANDQSIPTGSINTINGHMTNITCADSIDEEMMYVRNLVTSRVISSGLNTYCDSHNNNVTKYYLKLKDLCRNIEVPEVYEQMKGEK